MTFKQIITKPWIVIIISAVLSALPLTFDSLFLLSWISFVPLFYVIFKHSNNKFHHALGRGFLFGFIYHACVYYWFLWFYPMSFAGLSDSASLAVVALAWLGISAVHGMLWIIPFLLCHLAQKLSKNALFLSFVCIIGALSTQKLTSIGELSFPWVKISLGQYKATPLIQCVSLFGTDGLDTIILLVNALITIFILTRDKKRFMAITSALIIFFTNLGFGLLRTKALNHDKSLTIMTVQASVNQDDKWSDYGEKICFNAYSSLTKENITDGVDLILWPESAVPKVYKNEGALKQYKKLSKELNTPIIAGVLLRNNGDHTNNAVLIDKDGVKANYTKRQLVPFGEYMPYQETLSRLFPHLTGLNIIEDDYVSGTDTSIMETGGGKAGSVICFESIYPSLTRQSVLDGAEVLIEITNDSWLKDSPAMTQHLAHGVFRSIENGRYLVRSANSGISAVIDNHGKVISQLGVNEQGTITDTIYFNDETTLYTLTGDLLFPICCAVVFGWAIILFIKKIKMVER